MIEIFIFIIVIILIVLVLILFYKIVTILVEQLFGQVFNYPIFVHFYFKKKKLNDKQSFILRNQFQFYKSLSDKEKHYFEHRVAKFIEAYPFISRHDFEINDEVKVLIASTSIMLSFGMRKYLFDVIDKVIVYPTSYLSTSSNEYHKGEFNPQFKAIVFSWEDFKAGFELSNDNLNLGIHEFAHVLHYYGLKSEDSSALIFASKYNQIRKEVNYEANKQKLITSNYFRIYAYTNEFEFLAVIIEHFFETPNSFKVEFPQLFDNVSKMLNHKH